LQFNRSLIASPYYIVVRRRGQALLSFFKLRLIVDRKDIYPLGGNTIVIPVSGTDANIVATDGFHFTRPLQLHYDRPGYYELSVCCAIDDLELLGGGFLLVFFYLTGFFTDLFVLKLLSFIPVLYFLFRYYFSRRSFIRFVPARR